MQATYSRSLSYQNSNVLRRCYGIQTSKSLCDINLSHQKVTQLIESGGEKIFPGLVGDRLWQKPNPISIQRLDKQACGGTHEVDYFCGGLPALMQAARLLKQEPTRSVVYVNDGQIAKTLQSGHQAHEHPSEWSTEDCKMFPLVKAMLRGMKLWPEQDPHNLDYSYINFPSPLKGFYSHPVKTTSLYAQFVKQRFVHSMTAIDNISTKDHWLCQTVKESLQFHKQISDEIQLSEGEATFTQNGRLYWSTNHQKMLQKEKVWKALGIDCRFLNNDQRLRTSLLTDDARLRCLFIPKDGRFFPETPAKIVGYLEKTYPNFRSYQANVFKLYMNKRPLAVEECSENGKIRTVAIRSFFGSMGHNQVFLEGSTNPLWLEVPVSGISALWRCTVDKKQLEARLDCYLTDFNLQEKMLHMLPVANLSNLHVTPLYSRIENNKVIIILRASQGANFNSLVANKNDLKNMWENLNFFIGNWELLSVGTCSRKTNVTNVPGVHELSSNQNHSAMFVEGFSGIGYSASAASREQLMKIQNL